MATTSKQLYRSIDHRMIGGVAGGLGEYFDIDPSIVRLIFVLATFFGGAGLPIYIVLWIILPEEKDGAIASEITMKKNVTEIKEKATEFKEKIKNRDRSKGGRNVFAIILIGLGFVALLDSLGLFRANIFWPLVLVALGFMMIWR